jgi:hypothetical protein
VADRAGPVSVEMSEGSRGPRFRGSFWLKVLLAFGGASLVAALLPGTADDGQAPPLRTLLLAGSLITLITTVGLYAGLRMDLGLPARVAIYAGSYNALVVLVKFVLAPRGLYEVNRTVPLTSFTPLSGTLGAVLTASFVLLLYLAAYWVIYRICRRRIEGLVRADAGERPKRARRIVLPVVAGAVVLSGTGGAALLIPLALVSSGGEYLDFVFSSAVSALIGLALAGASALAFLAFRSAAERAQILGDAAVLVSFFWVGLLFLALYHALWVVYILVLTSIWPLRVVVPK